jgi:hypothetical protein
MLDFLSQAMSGSWQRLAGSPWEDSPPEPAQFTEPSFLGRITLLR